MIDIGKIRIGDKVHYQPKHYSEDKWENGMVKEIPEDNLKEIRIVFSCGGDWENFQNYTSALTRIEDLYYNWKH